MEKGYYHTDRGYWQAIDYKPPVAPEPYQEPETVDEDGNTEPGEWITPERPHHFTDDYPEGTIEVPLRPSSEHEWDEAAKAWNHVPPPELTPDERRALMPSLSARKIRLGLINQGITPDQVAARRNVSTTLRQWLLDFKLDFLSLSLVD